MNALVFYFREVAAKELGELGAKGEELEACESGVASDLPPQNCCEGRLIS